MVEKLYADISKSSIDNLETSMDYSLYRYKKYANCTGKGVVVSILDSGEPDHRDIAKVKSEHKVSFCEEESGKDRFGHSTMISGIIKGSGKVRGIAPDAKLIYGKVMNGNGECGFNAVSAGVLWSIVKKADIIVLSLGSQFDYFLLKDAVAKAVDFGICVFAATGNSGKWKNGGIDFPARYEGVFPVSCNEKDKILKNLSAPVVNLDCSPMLTTAKKEKNDAEDRYSFICGSSAANAFYAGIAASCVEKYKEEGENDILERMRKDLTSMKI